MKLLDRVHHEDYGHEWYVQLVTSYPNFALVDCVVQWDDFPPDDWFPSILFGVGPRDLFGVSIRIKRFEIRLNLFHFSPRNLEVYKGG